MKKKKSQINLFVVLKTENITPNMQRITLKSDTLSAFPSDSEGRFIKLLFNRSGGTNLNEVSAEERPVARTYTIRRFIPDQDIIEVDFVRHITQDLQCGFASRWAISAEAGDTINIAGPGKNSSINTQADWFFLTADMTALPALAIKLKNLPDNAQGYAVVKIISEQDIQQLQRPKGIEIHWITETSMADEVLTLTWLEGEVMVWCACEFNVMRELRQYFRNDKDVQRDNLYISSYWKQGASEDSHKVIKRKYEEMQE